MTTNQFKTSIIWVNDRLSLSIIALKMVHLKDYSLS